MRFALAYVLLAVLTLVLLAAAVFAWNALCYFLLGYPDYKLPGLLGGALIGGLCSLGFGYIRRRWVHQ